MRRNKVLSDLQAAGHNLGQDLVGTSIQPTPVQRLPVIFRPSQKLCTKIKAGPLQAAPLDENPFADWSAHVFVVERTQYILVSNTKSLYSTVLLGKGITNESHFINHALSGIRSSLDAYGLASVYDRFVAPASETVRFVKALDRSVTSSLNQLIFHATAIMIDDQLSPHDLGRELNDILMSACVVGGQEKYGTPREAFGEMVNRVKL